MGNETETTADMLDIHIAPLRIPEKTEKKRETIVKRQLELGFAENWNRFIHNPDPYVRQIGDLTMLEMCPTCFAPWILHIIEPGNECKLEPFPSTSNSAITVHLDKMDQYKAVRAIAIYRQAQKCPKPTPQSVVQNITSEKRPHLPLYVKENHTYWASMVRHWDTQYAESKPLDKYFELINSLQKGGGEDLALRLQSEGLDFTSVGIVTKCLEKLAIYLEKTEMTKTEEINTKWNDLTRASDESTADFMARQDIIALQQNEAGMDLPPKYRAIQIFHKANLDATSRNIVIPQVDLTKPDCVSKMKTAILNVTPTTSGTYYMGRGRTQDRGNRNRSRSFSSSYRYELRCTCPTCREHDKDYNEKHGHKAKNGMRDQRNNSYNRRDNSYNRKDNNYSHRDNNKERNERGKNFDTIVSGVYLTLGGRQIVIDTGCVRSLVSKQDVPYLESLIGRKLKPTGKSFGIRFGDNKSTQTEAVVMVPFWDGEKVQDLEIGVVRDNIPFLLGLSFLRGLRAKIAIDDRLELKNGAFYPMIGGAHRHQVIEWTRELHCGPEKVNSSNSQRDSHDSYLAQDSLESQTDSHDSYLADVSTDSTIDPIFSNFFCEEETVCYKADITVNSRDRLLDNDSTKFLRSFEPLTRQGTYDSLDTDSVYLYKNNLTENMPVSNPFEYSDIENGILKNTHDRGIRNEIDLDEIEEEKIERGGNFNVSFSESATLINYDKHDPATRYLNREHILVSKNSTTYYSTITKKHLDIKTHEPEQHHNGDRMTINPIPANKALPIEMSFWIRSSGQITYLQTNETTNGSENMNFKRYVESKSGMESSLSDKNYIQFFESHLDEDEPEGDSERVIPLKDFSNKQIHDAHKKKAPKKRAVRGHKKSSQNLKPNADIPEIKAAMDDEISKFQKYNVFEEVNDAPYLYKVPSNWVVTKKDEKKEGKNQYKCRLVALGNLDKKVNLDATDSPTLSKESLRLILSTIANLEFQLQGCDVSSAFLQGAPLTRTVYMNPPIQYRTPGKVWLLKKPVYGLADSGRLWYQRLREEIIKLGCIELTGDGACFHFNKNGRCIGILGTHVDDLIYGGTPEFEDRVIKPLMQSFNISKSDHDSFVFCGMSLRQNSDYSIIVSQKDYAQTIEDLPDYSNMNDQEKTTLLKSVAGQCMYLNLTRPDLMFQSSDLLRVGKTLDERLKLAEKLIKNVKNGTGEIIFKKLGPIHDLQLMVHSDASFNNIKYGKVSTAGCVIILKGKNGNCHPIFWTSKPIIRVTRSTMAAEARALELAADYAVLFSRQIKEIYTGYRRQTGIPVHCYTDSNTLHDAIVSSRQVEEKSLVHLIYFLKDKILHDEIKRITWVSTKKMLADGLTKNGIQMDRLMNMINTGIFPKALDI